LKFKRIFTRQKTAFRIGGGLITMPPDRETEDKEENLVI
jgi:hypothetical protein